MVRYLKPSLNHLLIFVPITLYLEYAERGSRTLLFFFACLAVIPLAGLLGKATEALAARTSETIGGLLNATFGNAAELIIAMMALEKGLTSVVKASLTGSILGNLLLVLGVSFAAGGVRYKTQRFSPGAAGTYATTLTLAASALILPAMYHYLAGPGGGPREADLSLEISVVLIVTYLLGLLFALRTHKHLFSPGPDRNGAEAEPEGAHWSVRRSFIVLFVSTLFIALVSEALVASVEQAAHALGMTGVFVGVIVVAIIGNAAEHGGAVIFAWKDKMDLSIGVALGSSIQIALFVAPVVVFASHWIGPAAMDLVFTPAEVISVGLAVLITGQVTSDGESNWLEGVQLLSVYLILVIIFFFLPETAATAK
ncbi:MAG: calcium/proton exchanger [bacterium]